MQFGLHTHTHTKGVSRLKTYHKNWYFRVHTQTGQQLKTKEEYKALQFAVLTILTLRSLTLYIYGAPILDVSRSHTTTQHCR